MRNIAFSADEEVIRRARSRAELEDTTLNTQFRQWLESYAAPENALHRHESVMRELRGKVVLGNRLTRDELNER